MNYQTTAALVFGALIVLTAVTRAIMKKQRPKVGDTILIVVFIAAIPYTVTCLVDGGCTWFAWSIVVLLALLWLISLVPRKRDQDYKDMKR